MKGERRLLRYPPADRDAVERALRGVLESQPDVRFAYLHGSFAGGGPFRDVDVGVYLDDVDAIGLHAMALGAEAEDALSRELEAAKPPVDVRALYEAPLRFCYQVLRGGRLLTSRDEAFRIDWVARVVGRYLDLKPLRERALKEAMKACR